MQACEKCHIKLKWIDVYKSVWRRRKQKPRVACRQCETEHVITLESRIIDGLIFTSIGAFSVFFALKFVDTVGMILYFVIFFSVHLLLLALVYTFIPFIYKYHSKYHVNYQIKGKG
ncbi:TIGR04104 family putative zinc finger protein [Oceanobacillus sp. CAU 1775]